jgi:hypothetical protein
MAILVLNAIHPNYLSFMKAAKPMNKIIERWYFIAGLLAIILAVLFWRSFAPGYVHFSNDGPLGAQTSEFLQFSGKTALNSLDLWDDLNVLGINSGSFPFDLNTLFHWWLGPLFYAKFSPPIALLFLGFSAWIFLKQLKLTPLAALLGALAAALNSEFLATAAWGLAGQLNAFSLDFLALALVVSNNEATPALTRWTRLALAGLAVGMNVMEAADIGAIFSLFVAAFVLFKAIVVENGSFPIKLARGVGRVALVAIFAGFMAIQVISLLLNLDIKGVAGTAQDTETKAQHWDFATQWSMPKKETLGLFVPGLFGYKMDTPNNMMPAFQDGGSFSYKGGVYWGGVGRDPAIDRFFDSGQAGTPPQGFIRFSGGQSYCGILVALVAFWAIAQSRRGMGSIFPLAQKKFIWFWAVVLFASLLFAYGRFAPFYALLYKLPYFSTIRNPIKFLHVFSWAMVILFAYGIDGLSRLYLEPAGANAASLSLQLGNWWKKARGFDRRWALVCAAILGISLLGWFIYASEKPGLVHYLQAVGFGDESTAGDIAAFSIGQLGWFVFLFALAAGLLILVIAGFFSGKRSKLGGFLLGLLLVFDLSRANLPYIIHWDYKQKYEVGSLNPVVDFLRDKPYEHRVAILPFHPPQGLELFDELYRIEWAQHHFLYYNIQSLDIIQMPRMPEDLAAYTEALAFRNTPDTIYLIARRWELTNTRYLLGPAGFLDEMNEQLDPGQHRFRIVRRFDVVPKPGILQPTKLEELTAVPGDNGAYALFDFTGALPRAKLFSNWQVSTNDGATRKTLADKNFDPQQTVLISNPLPASSTGATSENSGTVEFKSYASKDIVFNAKAATPTVLLLNDKYDPNWSVTVDGKPAQMLRCNFIMRGVYLTPGAHMVEFQFSMPNTWLYVTLAAIGIGFLLCGLLFYLTRRQPAQTLQQ